MMSTTPNKKAVLDFLWDWGLGFGDWGKLLVSKVVFRESLLSDEERYTVFNYFLKSIALIDELPDLSLSKPEYHPTKKTVEIISLSSINGVNRLAKNQVIDFDKRITIVYGENGTGKTGYSRILKSI